MRKLIPFLLLASSLLFSQTSLAENEGRELVVSLDLSYKSDYVIDNGLNFGGPVAQTELVFLYRGWSFIYWSSVDIDRPYKDNVYSNETDFLVFYDHSLSEKWTLTLGGGIYMLPPQQKLEDDFLTVSAALSRSFGEHGRATCSGAVEALFPVSSEGFSEGRLLKLSLEHSPSWGRFTLNYGGRGLYDDGLAGGDPGVIGRAWVRPELRLGERFRLYAIGQIDAPLSGADDGTDSFHTGAGVNISF